MLTSPLFARISQSDAHGIAQCARSQTFVRNDILFMQGEMFQRVTLIYSGWAKLTHVNENGGEVILAFRGTGDILDLPTSQATRDHAYTAQAITTCRTMVWDRLVFSSLVEDIPRLGWNISRVLESRLAQLEQRYCELACERVERRVACGLLRLAAQIGTPVDDGISVATSRLDLARMTGTTLFTVSRLISRWSEQGLIVPKRQSVLILDLAGLDSTSYSNGRASGRSEE